MKNSDWLAVLGAVVILAACANAIAGWRRAPAAFTALLKSIAVSTAAGALIGYAVAYHMIGDAPSAVLLGSASNLAASESSGAPSEQPASALKPTLASLIALQPGQSGRRSSYLIVGGDDNTSSYSSTELYDADTNSFSPGPNMITARSTHTVTLLTAGPNAGKALIAGGGRKWGEFLATTELYDPVANAFLAGPMMNYVRGGAAAIALPNGRVLIAGGTPVGQLNSSELYDPVTNSFLPPAQTAMMTVPRRCGPVTVLLTTGPNAGKVLLAGGFGYGQGGAGYLASSELYDPAANTFTAGPSLIEARANATGTLLSTGNVLVAGGFNGSSGMASTEIYQASSNSFVPGPALSVGRANAVATLLTSGPNAGNVLIAGGFPGCCHETAVASTDIYQSATNTIVPGPTMSAAREHPTATMLTTSPRAGDVLIAGGDNAEGVLRSSDLYQAASNSFVVGPNMTIPRTSAVAVSLTQ
jgi:hypothetical protein